ncbi:MAG: MarR family winged helix-turn-helix transcriptional regulator [Candidatus Sericytochromatia bacterium]
MPDFVPSPFSVQLRGLFRLVRRNSRLLAESHGVTLQQMVALFELRELGRCTISELLPHLDVTSGALSGLIDRLERQGLVLREPGVADRRQVYLALTEDGHRLVAAIAHDWEAHAARWRAGMPPAQAEQLETVLSALLTAGEAQQAPDHL